LPDGHVILETLVVTLERRRLDDDPDGTLRWIVTGVAGHGIVGRTL
jgi:hypothetical protein